MAHLGVLYIFEWRRGPQRSRGPRQLPSSPYTSLSTGLSV